MSALATPTLRRLPVGGGIAACGALAAAMIAGPGGTPVPTAILSVAAILLLSGELVRRAIVLLRSGLGAQVLLGLLTVAVIIAAWSIVVRLHAEFVTIAVVFVLIGLALIGLSVIDARGRVHRGATPWQALTGGPTVAARARGAVGGLGSVLVGLLFVFIGLRFATSSAMDVPGVWTGRAGFAGAMLLAGAIGAGWFARGLVARRRPGGLDAASATPTRAVRDEQVVAAHLHDSVLQTLALIQRSASDPARVSTLARQQERSLRAWLAGRDETAGTTLAGALRAAAQEVEDEQPGTVIEVVAVNDAPLDREADAMVRAAREAMRNAARHGSGPVRVFFEVEHGSREVYVRDTGAGFDLADVADERRGVRDAIIGRMEHVGGTATIDSGPGGTEIGLRLPAAPSGRSGS